MIATGMRRWLAAAEPEAFRTATGLRWVTVGEEMTEQSMAVPAWLCESGGRLAAGCVAILADSTLGVAAAASQGAKLGVVTLGLHIDLGAELPGEGREVAIASERVWKRGHTTLVTGLVSDQNGVIGYATWRGLFVGFAERHDRTSALTADGPGPVGEVPRSTVGAGSSIDETLRTEAVTSDAETVSSFAVATDFASGWRTVHGGVVALVAQRAAHHAFQPPAADGASIHTTSLDVDFFRPVPSSSARLRGAGRVVNVGRTYRSADADILLANGRLAATLRTTQRLVPPG